MSYLEATLIVGGAVDAVEQFVDPDHFKTWLAKVKDDASHNAEIYEVYTLDHPHGTDVECECAQYSTSHLPYWSDRG